MLSKLSMLAVSLLTIGCATTSEKLARQGIVIPGQDGVYVATSTSTDKREALQIALASAEQECKKQQKSFVVLNRQSEKVGGLIDDETAEVVDVGTKIANSVGAWLPIVGDDLKGKTNVDLVFKCSGSYVSSL